MAAKDTQKENIDLIAKIVGYWFTDKSKILPLLAKDCVYEVSAGSTWKGVPIFGTYRGPKRVESFFKKLDEQLITSQCFRPRRNHYHAEGDRVSVSGSTTYQLVGKRKTFHVYWWLLWTVRRGKVVRLQWKFDEAKMSEAFKKK